MNTFQIVWLAKCVLFFLVWVFFFGGIGGNFIFRTDGGGEGTAVLQRESPLL